MEPSTKANGPRGSNQVLELSAGPTAAPSKETILRARKMVTVSTDGPTAQHTLGTGSIQRSTALGPIGGATRESSQVNGGITTSKVSASIIG